MKSIIFTFIIFSCSFLNAQKAVVQIKDVIGEDRGKVKESFTIVNKDDGSFALFIIDTRATRAYLYNSDYKEVARIVTEKVLNKGVTLMGYTITGQSYQLITKGVQTGSLVRTLFDFDTKEVSKKDMVLNLKKQSFLEFFALGSKMYLFTLDEDSSNLIHYSIDDQGVAIRNEIVIENTFYNSDGRERDLKEMLESASTAKILPDDKTTIQQATELLKLYFINEDHIALTVDYSNTAVHIFDISLETFDVKEQTFFRAKPVYQEFGWNANSFLKDDYLFQIVSNRQEMIISVTDRRDSTLVKTINVNRDDEMTFTNSSMILEKTEEDRILEKTRQFLKKLASTSNGIAVSSVGENYQITIGGKIGSSGSAGYTVHTFNGGGAFTTEFAPNFIMIEGGEASAYYTSVECVFDTSFNHIPDVNATSLMMKRRDFLSPDIKNVAETFFAIKEDYFLGMYYKEADMYVIRKF